MNSTEFGKGRALFPRTPQQGTGSRPEARVLRRMQPSTAPAKERVRWAVHERVGATTKKCLRRPRRSTRGSACPPTSTGQLF